MRMKFVLLLGLVIIIYVTNFFYNASNELSNNPIKFEKDIPVEYLSLFNSKFQKSITQHSATSFKLRNTIANVSNNEYDLMLTKIPVNSKFVIKVIIVNVNKEFKYISPETYSSYNLNNFKIIYNGVSNSTVSKIYLTLDGESTTTCYKNDSLFYCYSNLKHEYLQYNYGGISEITIEAKKRNYFFDNRKSIIIMLMKKKDFAYFIILTDKNNNDFMRPDTLYKMIQ